MLGKCQKTAREPPQGRAPCYLYIEDRCPNGDKCSYLHKGFPCKFFHTGAGRSCGATAESCKFSHGPLNDLTRSAIIKVT